MRLPYLQALRRWKPTRNCSVYSVVKYLSVQSPAQQHKIHDVVLKSTASPNAGKNSSAVSDAGALPHPLWTEKEIKEQLSSMYRHTPVTLSDMIMKGLVRTL
jgi:hypothetical protein